MTRRNTTLHQLRIFIGLGVVALGLGLGTLVAIRFEPSLFSSKFFIRHMLADQNSDLVLARRR